MGESRAFEEFPLWMPLVSSIVSLSIYATGAMILTGYGTGLVALYLLYCAAVEVRVMKKSCVNCYYYGKRCGIGKGRLAAVLFKKGDPEKFVKSTITAKELIPDFLVSIFPFVAGIVLLIRDFSPRLALLMAVLVLTSLVGNALVRGQYACKYCKQRELDCSAERFFSKG